MQVEPAASLTGPDSYEPEVALTLKPEQAALELGLTARFSEAVAYLRKTWATILSQGQRMPPTSLLYQDLNLAQRVLRDFVNDETSRIQVDSRETHQMLADFAAEFTPAVSSKLHHYTGERPLFDLYNIETIHRQAGVVAGRVEFESGAVSYCSEKIA